MAPTKVNLFSTFGVPNSLVDPSPITLNFVSTSSTFVIFQSAHMVSKKKIVIYLERWFKFVLPKHRSRMQLQTEKQNSNKNFGQHEHSSLL